eukprot:1651809-Rhodomonas_salina.3
MSGTDNGSSAARRKTIAAVQDGAVKPEQSPSPRQDTPSAEKKKEEDTTSQSGEDDGEAHLQETPAPIASAATFFGFNTASSARNPNPLRWGQSSAEFTHAQASDVLSLSAHRSVLGAAVVSMSSLATEEPEEQEEVVTFEGEVDSEDAWLPIFGESAPCRGGASSNLEIFKLDI